MSISVKINRLFEVQTLAYLMGGRCLSKEYINDKTSLEWQCQKGHRWEATYHSIRQGGWCMSCARHEGKLLKLTEYATEHGGKLLSTQYINSKEKYQWQCSKGHIWNQTFSNLRKSGWCPKCKKERFDVFMLNRLRNKVQQREGILLSEKYNSSYGLLKVQCKEGHQWQANAQNLLIGYWCKKCAGSDRLNLQQMQEVAAKKGGKCLSASYKNKDAKLLWQCSKGHQWMATPRNVMASTWCPKCRIKNSDDTNWPKVMKQASKKFFLHNKHFKKHTLAKAGGAEMANFLAGIREGQCLTKEYTHSRVKMQWQCKHKHTWFAPMEFITAGCWCPYCNGKNKSTLNEIQQLAKVKGGKCLSTEYKNSNQKLLWQCSKGHQWESTLAHIKKGSWCHTCNGGKRLTLEYMQAIALKHGGKCLSTTYINKYTKLLWECGQGHQWHTTYSTIYKGSWCPQCGLKKMGKTHQQTMKAFNKTLKNISDI
jgi:thiol-disulfide isomerase/thioredoxin